MMGGSSLERVVSMFKDSKGLLWLGGNTFSSDFNFDINKTSPDSTLPAIFLSSWDSKKKRVGQTYLFSGNKKDFLRSMFMYNDYSIYLAGLTFSKDLIPETDFCAPYGNEAGDGFLFRLNLLSSELEFATYWGGEGFDEISSICVFEQEYVWVAGTTSSTQLPVTLSAFQKDLTGYSNGFISEILCIPKSRKPELLFPENNSMETNIDSAFYWNDSSLPVKYKFFLFDSKINLVYESDFLEQNYFILPMLLDHDVYYHWMVHLFNSAGLMTASDIWRFKTETEKTSLALITKTNKRQYHYDDLIYLKICIQNIGNTSLSGITLYLDHSNAFQILELLPDYDYRIDETQLITSLTDIAYQGYLIFQIKGSFLSEKAENNQITMVVSLFEKDKCLCKDEVIITLMP
jgi:hypothetical protein